MHSLFLFLALLATAAAAFPVTELIVTQSFLDALANHSIPAQQRDNMATQAILPQMRSFFGPSSTAIDMTPTDIGDISGSLPDQVVDSSCSHKVTAEVSLSYDMPNAKDLGAVPIIIRSLTRRTLSPPKHPKGNGALLNSSYLRFGMTNISWKSISVFADAEVDVRSRLLPPAHSQNSRSFRMHAASHITP